MNVLDIAQNSVAAGATLTQILLTIRNTENQMVLTIIDNGKGMSEEMVQTVTDPFCTTRTTRKVGLGLPFLKMAAEITGGALTIESTLGVGTTVTASFTLGHIDLMPLGDIAQTITSLIQCNPELDFVYTLTKDEKTFTADTREFREILDGVSFAQAAVAVWLEEYLAENTNLIMKE